MIRSANIANDNYVLQCTMLLQWYATVILQILTQVGTAPGGMAAPAAPSQVMLTMGINVMVAYLDYKARTTPEDMSSLDNNNVVEEQPQEQALPSKQEEVAAPDDKSNNLSDEAEDVSESMAFQGNPSASADA